MMPAPLSSEIFGKIGAWLSENSTNILESFIGWLSDAGVSILLALAIIVVGFWVSNILSRLCRRMLKNTKANRAAISFGVSVVRVLIRIIVIIAAIARLGINVASIITALGAAGITIGLAMQETLSNVASGVLILMNSPFTIGDFVEINGETGTVRAIELTYTALRTVDNREIIIPNSKIANDSLINYTADPNRRLDILVPLPYSTDIQLAKQVLCEAARESKYVDQNNEIVIGIKQLSASSIDFEQRSWIRCNENYDYWVAYFDMQELILAKLAEAGIEVPFNQLDVHMK